MRPPLFGRWKLESSTWRVAMVLLGFLLLTLPLTASLSAAARKDSGPHADSQLLQAAQDNPDQSFRVIVQGKGNNGHEAADSVVKAKKHAKVAEAGDVGVVTEVSGKDLADLASDPAVKYVAVDAPLVSTSLLSSILDPSRLVSTYPKTIGATSLWNRWSGPLTGTGVGVAVVDTGITPDRDFDSRLVVSKQFNTEANGSNDGSGHGTDVAGIIGGNGWNNWLALGQYIGVAPDANLINVKVGYANGQTYTSDLVNGIDWVIANRQAYNIRVMNLSMVSSTAESYQTSIIDAEVERAWFNGIFVVVSAGNSGPNTLQFPPANDPFVVTVGAEDELSTSNPADDTVISWSSYGTTQDGFAKPDVVAPGRHIASVLAGSNVALALQFPDRLLGNGQYIWLSGTSMSAAVVSGAAALALQAHPDWTNDQLKGALMQAAKPVGGAGQGAGRIDVPSTLSVSGPALANQGIPISGQLIGPNGATLYTTASWSTSSWSSSSWSSSSWSSSSWSSSSWSSSSGTASSGG